MNQRSANIFLSMLRALLKTIRSAAVYLHDGHVTLLVLCIKPTLKGSTTLEDASEYFPTGDTYAQGTQVQWKSCHNPRKEAEARQTETRWWQRTTGGRERETLVFYSSSNSYLVEFTIFALCDVVYEISTQMGHTDTQSKPSFANRLESNRCLSFSQSYQPHSSWPRDFFLSLMITGISMQLCSSETRKGTDLLSNRLFRKFD